MGRVTDAGWHASGRLVSVAPVPDLPEPKPLELPGRGRTVYLDTGLPAADNAADNAAARPTLILLHALACTGLLSWYPCWEELRRRYRVVLFDQRWHGRGIRAAPFRLEDCADDVAAVADALQIDTFVPVGYSMGSLVAQLTWRQHPDRVDGAVLAASTSYFHSHGGETRALRLLATQLYRSAERRIAAVPIVGAAPAGQPVPKQHNDNVWALRQLRTTSPAEIAGAAAAISRFDSAAWVGGMDVPTSVVIPTRDRAIPPSRQRQLARALPQSTVYEYEGGHASIVMNAAAFRPALLAACASVTTRLASAAALRRSSPAPR